MVSLTNSTPNLKAIGKRFRWSQSHDELLLREVIKSKIWNTKPGTTERGDNWTTIAEALNAVKFPVFSTNRRSARDRFQHLVEKQKTKDREQKQVSGKVPEVTEVDKLLDNVIELFESAYYAKEKADEMSLDAGRGTGMRRMPLERMREPSKRKSDENGESFEKRVRSATVDTFELMKEKVRIDSELRRNEYESKEHELEEQVRRRENEEIVRRICEENQERNVLRQLESVKIQLQQQNQILLQLCEQQQQHSELIMNLIQNLNDRN